MQPRTEPSFDYRLELAGFETRAIELEGDGPPLLLLHGWADSADTWRVVLDRLARRRRRALALDLPGFGAAAPLRPGPMLAQHDAFVRAAVEWMADEYGADVAIAGNSLGGCLALRAGARRDLPLHSIVPVAPAGLDMPRWFDVVERDPLMRALLALPLPVPEFVVRTVVGEVYRQLAFARPRTIPPEVVNAFTSHHATLRAVRRMLDSGHRLLPELRTPFALADVACPVMLVWGDQDRMVAHGGARHVLEALPAARYELLEGVGHCPQLEAADRLTALVCEFTGEELPQAA